MLAYLVSRNATLLYAFLLDQTDDSGECLSFHEAANHAGLGPDERRAALKELEDGEFVRVFHWPVLIAQSSNGKWSAHSPRLACELTGFTANKRHARLTGNVWAQLRASTFERDDFTCQYCFERGGPLECDHVIPLSRGGTNELGNLVTACVDCNRSKRAQLIEQWHAK